jgi:DNA primase
LCRHISIEDVLDVIGFIPTARLDHKLRGPCPIHADESSKNRAFSADLKRNIFRCVDPDCNCQGNPLDLYMAHTDLPFDDAVLDLCMQLGIDILEPEIR